MKTVLTPFFVAALLIAGPAYATDSYTVNAGQTLNITEFSECKSVTNSHASGLGIMVPTKTQAEWQSFYDHTGAGVTAGACGVASECTNNGGVVVGGYCWFKGTLNQNCNTVCTSQGGYNAATLSYAGSGGSQANCQAVLTAVSAAASVPVPSPLSTNSSCSNGALGCTGQSTYAVWCSGPATTATASHSAHYRYCACNRDTTPLSGSDCIIGGGKEVGGGCWFYGAAGDSCDTVCTGRGGYNALTRTYAGDTGTDAQCQAVLDAIGAGGSGSPSPYVQDRGCLYYNNDSTRYRGSQPTVSSSSLSGSRRACACNLAVTSGGGGGGGPGELYAWGAGLHGNGSFWSTQSSPIKIGTDTNWTTGSAGQAHSCAISAGKLYCWGDNTNGTTGLGLTSGETQSPTQVGSSTTWTVVEAGESHTCGIDAGKLYCWGYNMSGRTGLGTTSGSQATPAQVGSATTWTSVDSSGYGSCGINGGKLYCWGDNMNGRTGLGTTSGTTNSPTQVGSATDWSKVYVGGTTSCAIKTGKTLYCWAGAYGTSPVQVGTDTDWVSLTSSPGSSDVCGIKTSGALYCWTGSATPTQFETATDWSSIAIGNLFRCGTRAGKLYCWGDNTSGRTGLGTTTGTTASPAQVGTATTWSGVFPSSATRAIGILGTGVSATVFTSDFSTQSVGAPNSDWTLAGTAAIEAVAGTLSGKVMTVGTGLGGVMWNLVPAATDFDVYVVVRSDVAGSGIRGPSVRVVGSDGYAGGMFGTNQNAIWRGTSESIASASAAWSVNTWYVVRLQAVGSTLRIKRYAYGSAEPGTWDLTGTNTVIAGPGLFALANPGSPMKTQFQYVSVGINGDSAVPPPSGGGCAGSSVGGSCWYLGAYGESCDTVCSTHGGYNDATKTYAGSSGTDANCLSVLTALSGGSGSINSTSSSGFGCWVFDSAHSYARYRSSGTTDSSTAQSTVRRACACNN